MKYGAIFFSKLWKYSIDNFLLTY